MKRWLLILAATSAFGSEKPLVTIVFNSPVTCGQAIQAVRAVPVSINCNADRKAEYAYTAIPVGVTPVARILGQLRRLRGIRRAEIAVNSASDQGLPPLPGGY